MTGFLDTYGPTALVAGASEGLGAAFATELAVRGLNLVLVARREEKLRELATSLQEKFRVRVSTFQVDLADSGQIENMVSTLPDSVNLLVYNAAFAPIGRFDLIPTEDLLKTTDVNVRGPILLTRLLLPSMLKNGRGGIVLMSSLAGGQGSPKLAAYAASKAYNTVLAEGLWHECKDQGVDILSCVAGAIRTPGYEGARKQEAPGTLGPDEVARQCMDALGKGPTVVPGRTNRLARFFMGRLLPRKLAISLMAKNTKDLS